MNFAEVYIDESGSHDGSPLLAVAGYIFEKDRAIEFNREWALVLEREELPYFRMSAAAHCTDPFDGWLPAECDAVERQLIELIKRTTICGFAVTVNESEYDTIGPKHPGLGGAYSFCLRQCMMAVRACLDEANFDGKVAYFFESGHRHQGEASSVMQRVFNHPRLRSEYRYASHTFADKSDVRPLQTGDLLAWQWFTDATRKRRGNRVSRKDMLALVRPQDKVITWTRERVAEIGAEIKAGRVTIF